MCEVFQLPGQPEGVSRVTRLEGGELVLRLLFIVQGAGAFPFAFGGFEGARVFQAHRALGHGHNAEICPVPAATLDGVGDFLHVVGKLGN